MRDSYEMLERKDLCMRDETRDERRHEMHTMIWMRDGWEMMQEDEIMRGEESWERWEWWEMRLDAWEIRWEDNMRWDACNEMHVMRCTRDEMDEMYWDTMRWNSMRWVACKEIRSDTMISGAIQWDAMKWDASAIQWDAMQWSGDMTTASVGHATTSRYSAWFLENRKTERWASKKAMSKATEDLNKCIAMRCNEISMQSVANATRCSAMRCNAVMRCNAIRCICNASRCDCNAMQLDAIRCICNAMIWEMRWLCQDTQQLLLHVHPGTWGRGRGGMGSLMIEKD